MTRTAILLLASGRGTRLGSQIPKAYLELGGRSLVVRSLERLAHALPDPSTRDVVLAIHPEDRSRYVEPLLERMTAACGGTAPKVVDGGATRQESMERALAAVDDDASLVLIHDAARPFFPIEATREAVAAATEHGAAVVAVPTPDTLKKVEGGRVVSTLDRTGVWQAQTPQVVRRDLLVAGMADARARGAAVTDDVSLVEAMPNAHVVAVRGARTNLKITTPDDMILGEALAAHFDAHTD